ncbi:MAG: hypothetical protein ACK5QT_02630 [Oligoflexia bacterium]|jgi:hypothetical protein
MKFLNWLNRSSGELRVLKRGHAMRVIFFYPGEEGTYVDNAEVTLFENGLVHLRSSLEETTTHLQNCEILWRFRVEGEERVGPGGNKLRLLKPRTEAEKQELEQNSGTPPESL